VRVSVGEAHGLGREVRSGHGGRSRRTAGGAQLVRWGLDVRVLAWVPEDEVSGVSARRLVSALLLRY